MLKKSFHCFITRGADNPVEITTFERDNNIIIPPLFKLFITYFEWEKGTIPIRLEYNCLEYSDKRLIQAPLVRQEFLNRPYFSLTDFFSLQEGFDIGARNYSIYSDNITNRYLVIGAIDPTHSCLMLGTNDDNLDSIFIDTEIYDKNDNPIFEKIANNIFEFVHSIYYKINDIKFSSIELNQVYKKWDDDKWYVREDVKDFMTLTEKRRMERKNHPEKFD